MWGLFERYKVLREESNKAIQLDSKVQQLVWLLDYLCDTAEGVPLNELATYLSINLKGKKQAAVQERTDLTGKIGS